MSTDTPSIPQHVEAIRARIARAATMAGRHPDSVRLVAITKTRTVEEIAAVHAAGVADVGENYVQEALPKILALRALPLTWHFVGRIQANKTRDIAQAFDWVHTVDRARVATRLDSQVPEGKTLDVCLQVNVDADPDKGGIAVEDDNGIAELIIAFAGLERLRLRGMMTILAETTPPAEGYRRLGAAFLRHADRAGAAWDTLSMGMSGDFEAAIAAGSTQVRIGQALFGPRNVSQQSVSRV